MKRLAACAALASLTALPAFADSIGIVQKDQTFSKLSLTVASGDTVMWGNDDDVTHNITIRNPDGKVVDMGAQKHGQVIKARFDDPGVYAVRCSIHPKMKMAVVVQ